MNGYLDMAARLFTFIGGFFCHQLPARTLMLGGAPLGVCVRCTGVYMGVATAALFLLFIGRFAGNKPFSVPCAVVLAVFITPLMVDGVTSAIGLRETTNTIRLLTGVFLGACLPPLFVLAYRFRLTGKNEKPIINVKELALLPFVTLFALFLANVAGIGGWLLVNLSISAGLLFVVTGVILAVYRLWKLLVFFSR